MALLHIAVSSSFGLSNRSKTVLFHITLTMHVLAILYDLLIFQAVHLLAIVNFTATTNSVDNDYGRTKNTFYGRHNGVEITTFHF